MMHECLQRATSICHICGRHSNSVRQTLRIDCNMTLNSRYLFAGVISFALGAVGIFYALRINDAKRRLFFAAKADAGRANRIFLCLFQQAQFIFRCFGIPAAKIRIHGTPFRLRTRQHAPLASTFQYVQNATKYLV